MKEHNCKWEPIGTDKIVCNVCQVVTTITTLLNRNTAAIERDTKVRILAEQLFARELKKDAHARAYTWIKANAPDALTILTEQKQGVLL